MLRNYYINKDFIVSATARKVYRFTATISLGMLAMLFATILSGGVPGILQPFFKQLLFVGAFGSAVTIVAMDYFLFAFDRSSPIKKACWFVLVTLIPLPGAAIYCFRVYSRSEIVNKVTTNEVGSASA
jgi:hypothetical protein